MSDRIELDGASELMKALGNATRIAIVSKLSDGSELTIKEISEGPIRGRHFSQSGVSQHMAVLRRSGVVSARREHPKTFYSLNHGTLEEAKEVLNGLKAEA